MPTARSLSDLFDAVPELRGRSAADTRVSSITTRSEEVVPGALFVALRGTRVDGHAFVDEAARRGAAAAVVEEDGADPGIPVFRVPDTRLALAALAAEWHGRPAERLSLVGITGTVGKTSTLAVLEALLAAAGVRVGTIGSLGVKVDGEPIERHGYTAPDPLLLHGEMARLVEEGCRLVAMEVTSHALVQERVAGLRYGLGIFTNLLPLEHAEYHGTFADYVRAKVRFFDHLEPGAPVVHNADDRAVRRVVRERPVTPVACGTARTATVRVEPESVSASGTKLVLNVRRPFPRMGGGEVAPVRIPVEMRLLGRSNLSNAALAATAALALGVGPDTVREVLAGLTPPRRRLEMLHRGRFLVIDDTVGHPDSVSALFEVVGRLEPRRIQVAFAVRGQRGPRINGHVGKALAIWAEQLPLGTLVLTRSAEAADERNRVEEREYAAFVRPLRAAGIPFTERERLDEAVPAALEAAEEGDIVLLLGAQGMDRGAEIARGWLGERGGG
jgi:UDP-N-acetylmuramoyl-L-alanyl-D-glutamate--2,6-diaminopimelate ligase